MSERPDLRVEMVSNPRYLCALRELMISMSRQLDFTETQCSQIALAVDEAVTNIIRHGYAGRTDRPIVVAVMPFRDVARGEGVRIVIEDEARQVDPSTIRGRDLADIRPGGLGVHIIREVMDDVAYERRGAAGMRLTLVKIRQPSAPARAACP
ncbi:MAG: ATP-binding protein [Planctomycetota bacterium]|nr:ATP-binding protein [Planctomycetota bacterium]